MRRHTYIPPVKKKDNKAIEIAKVRAEASIEWHKTNTLTSETLNEFKRFIQNAELKYKLKINKP